MNYLNDKEIIERIDFYLKENIFNYAILIDGEWGCGKTHFVKHILIPELMTKNPDRKSVYVSLYGLKETKDIANSILIQIAEHKFGKGKKLPPMFDVIGNIGKATFELLGQKLLGEGVKEVDLENLLSPFFDYDKHYFIFDDLERCSIPINDVMGYINLFLEQNSAKVLILANEKEIGTIASLESDILKYLVASQNSILWPKYEKDSFVSALKRRTGLSKDQVKPDPPDIDEIKFRINLLFDENGFYLKIKEKLVGQTISYRPTLQEIVPPIISECLKGKLSNINLQEFADATCSIMVREDHFNLRTLQSGLLFHSRVMDAFPPNNLCPTIYQELG